MRGCFLFLVLFALVFSYGCQTSDLTSGEKGPAISSINPAQVSRGQQNVKSRIQGNNFTGIVAVDLDSGIKIHATTIQSPTELEVMFSVNSDAPTGKRTIRVATAGGVATNSDLLSVNENRAPNAVFSVSPNRGAKDTLFSFDASGSNDPDGTITGYSWDFGDGATANGKEVTHRFNSGGNFQVKLTVTDNHQGSSTNQKEVVVENVVFPIARFTYSPRLGPVTTVFQFDGSGSTDHDGRIVSWNWNFGDGTTAKGKTVRHKFNRVSDFDVELTVKDNSDLESSITKTIGIRGRPPVAEFSVSPNFGSQDTNFQFNASASSDDGGISSYEWNFGDNTTGSGRTITHRYSRDGDYNVRLTVTDHQNQKDTASHIVSVGSGGGGGGGGGGVCTNPAPGRGFLYGTIKGYRGQWAIVQLDDRNSTCANSFYKCGDMRKANTSGRDEFFGIIKHMTDLGNGLFEVYNDCPLNWPPANGTRIFLYWKNCSKNSCP